jgi:hypothetical protein
MVESISGFSNVNQAGSIGSVTSNAPVGHNKGSSSDSVGKSSSSSSSNKAVLAESPELQEAMYILWFSNNQMIVQPYGNNKENTSAVSAAGQVNPIALEVQNKMHQIAISVLDAWSKSIKEQADADKREEKSDKHQVQLAENLKAGFSAYLSTLTYIQRSNLAEFNTLTGVGIPKEGFVEGLDEVLLKSKTGSADYSAAIPFISGSVLSAVPGSVAVTSMQTTPITTGVEGVMSQITPAYSVDLSSMANLYINGSMNMAALRVFEVAPGAPASKMDYQFARNYAQEILKSVSGSDFNSWAMAIITHTIEPGQQMDDKYVADLTGKLKISMLSTALSYLYQMESSFKGAGGGVTGQEFQDLVMGKMALAENDPKTPLVNQIRYLLALQDNPTEILQKIGHWIDDSAKGLNLTKVSPLFNMLKLESGGLESVTAA